MIIVFDVWCSDEFADFCSHAVVDFNQEHAKALIRYMDLVKGLKGMNSNINTLSFWDYAATFFRSNEEISEKYLNECEGEEYFEVPDDLMKVLENDGDGVEVARTEMDLLIVDSDDLYWRSALKNTNVTYETRLITRKVIERIAAGLSLEEDPAPTSEGSNDEPATNGTGPEEDPGGSSEAGSESQEPTP